MQVREGGQHEIALVPSWVRKYQLVRVNPLPSIIADNVQVEGAGSVADSLQVPAGGELYFLEGCEEIEWGTGGPAPEGRVEERGLVRQVLRGCLIQA